MRSLTLATLSLLMIFALVLSACNIAPPDTPTPAPLPTDTPGAPKPTVAPTSTAGVAGSTAANPAALPNPDYKAMIDVGAYKLSIQCWGTGSPVVILDADLGVPFDTWKAVVPGVAGTTRVCAYNRAGVGDSERSPMLPRTVVALSDELYRMFDTAKVATPRILVAAGVAALSARLTYTDHGADYLGMIFVEPTSTNAKTDMAPLLPAASASDSATLKAWRQFFTDTGWFSWPEGFNLDSSITLAQKVTSVGDMPLTILWPGAATIDGYVAGLPADTATKVKAVYDKWQKEAAALSNKSEVRVSTQAGAPIEQKDPALVVKAILDMLAKVKAK